MVVSIRHSLFEWNVFKTQEYDIPVVCVGNITVGGTGKTPHTEYLLQILSRNYKVAVISRGYKRKTKGYVLATEKSSVKQIGDEPKQIKLKFPKIPVAVCEKRAEGIRRLREDHPEVNLIILDDAFQHRYVEPWVNIVLMDYNNPVYKDHFLPWGRLRDSRKQMVRAHIVIVTKCPVDLRPFDYRIVRANLELYSYQTLYFTTLKSEKPVALFPDLSPPPIRQGDTVIAMAGIANPTGFFNQLADNYEVAHKIIYPDHHGYTMRDIHNIEALLTKLPKDTPIIVTEKDAVKLMNARKISQDIRRRIHYVSITIDFANNLEASFTGLIYQYVKENQKHNITHPI